MIALRNPDQAPKGAILNLFHLSADEIQKICLRAVCGCAAMAVACPLHSAAH